MADKKSKKERVQFDFSPALLAELEELQAILGSTSRAEAVRIAIRRQLYLARMEKAGCGIMLRHPGGKEVGVEFI